MATYAGVTFEEIVDSAGIRPSWAQRAYISERLIPYGNLENVQSAGRGNWRVTISAQLTAAEDLATLQAAVGATTRTLGALFGDADNSNVALIAVDNPWRFNTSNYWYCDLTFVRVGS